MSTAEPRVQDSTGGAQALPSCRGGLLQGTQGYQQLLSCCQSFRGRRGWEWEVDDLGKQEQSPSVHTDTAPTGKQCEHSEELCKAVKSSPLVRWDKKKPTQDVCQE